MGNQEQQSSSDAKNSSVTIHIGGNVDHSQILGAGHDMNIDDLQMSSGRNEIIQAFQTIYEQIDSRASDLAVDNEEIRDTVTRIETEVQKGDEAATSKISRWLQFLEQMAPDIFDVTVLTLANPIAGVTEAIRKIAQKAKEDADRQME